MYRRLRRSMTVSTRLHLSHRCLFAVLSYKTTECNCQCIDWTSGNAAWSGSLYFRLRRSAISSASTSGDAIPISHHVRRSLFTDETSPEQIPDPKLSLKEQTPDRSKSTEEKALSNKTEQLLPVKRSAAIPGQSTTDAPAKKKTAVTKADKE